MKFHLLVLAAFPQLIPSDAIPAEPDISFFNLADLIIGFDKLLTTGFYATLVKLCSRFYKDDCYTDARLE